ncbi:MAG: ABC transporter ATP-binding protein [Propionibacteriaceae bacterium]|jgi:ABC-type glutathione transport system ATPase component|nr:ABC transporter ATP-binding protein [Propionibacteriaceae bacterium]
MLAVEHLTVAFGRRPPAVRDISFAIPEGGRLGIIGASGSGKSVTALAIMGLLPEYARVGGSVKLGGAELVGLPDHEYSKLRGDALTMVFQEPMTALDPTMRVGRQIAEAYRLHAQGSKARDEVLRVLAAVGMPDPARVADSYPHELSGGQRQRALTAMAVINRPGLVVFDEPTTALDMLVQAQVLEMIDGLLRATGASCLFISHDIAVVAQLCAHILVMQDGQAVEQGETGQLLRAPRHPYTQALVAAARKGAVRG